MTRLALALTPLEQTVIRIARSDARGRRFLAAGSRRPLANPRLEALRRYAADRIGNAEAVPEQLLLAGYDVVERAAIDAWIARTSSPAATARETRVRHDRLATAAGIGIALASIATFAGLNVMLLAGI